MQLDDQLWIDMSGVENLPRPRDSRVQFFGYLPLQRPFLGFPLVDLSAGKLPVAGEVRALQATRDEEAPVLLDHRRNDDDALRHVVRSRGCGDTQRNARPSGRDRKSTRLNSSHLVI